jgi:hypothetical protein
MQHSSTPAIVRVQARAAKFQQALPALVKRRQIILGFAVKAACRLRHLGCHDTVNTNDLIVLRSRLVQQQDMVGMGVIDITFQARGMINQRTIATKLGDKDLIPEALCGADIIRRARYAGLKDRSWRRRQIQRQPLFWRRMTDINLLATIPRHIDRYWKPNLRNSPLGCILFMNEFKQDAPTINDDFTHLPEVDSNPVANVGLHLPYAPIRLLGMPYEHARLKNRIYI